MKLRILSVWNRLSSDTMSFLLSLEGAYEIRPDSDVALLVFRLEIDRILTLIFNEHVVRNIFDRISTKMSEVRRNPVEIGSNIDVEFRSKFGRSGLVGNRSTLLFLQLTS